MLRAHDLGHSVSVLHRGVHNIELPKGVEEIIVDRDDGNALNTAIRNIRADVLVDTFAMTQVQTSKTINSLAGNVGKVVVLSSQDVYAQFGRLNGHPAPAVEDLVTESSPLTVPFPFRGLADRDGGYDYDKKDVEAEYRNAVEKDLFEAVTVLRLPGVFGFGDYRRRFGAIVDTLDDGIRKLPCQNGATWRWTKGHVQNIAHAVVLSAEKACSGFEIFNVGEEITPTMRERVDRIANLLDISIEWEETDTLSDNYSILGKMPNDFVADTTKIRATLGYAEILLEKACYMDLIEWCRKSRKR